MSRLDKSSRSPQSKRQPREVGTSTFWLPLPERTGSDRDEPHCSPGFVDRAYLVFLLRTVNHSHSSAESRPTRVTLTPLLRADSAAELVRAPGSTRPPNTSSSTSERGDRATFDADGGAVLRRGRPDPEPSSPRRLCPWSLRMLTSCSTASPYPRWGTAGLVPIA